ncbi:unnamed protein product [Ceutorhynchus assimilis]|uniref:VPS37 C-terminal domain-containing protein n=1 Tax=Ceutorhynchus assimilis TaxID=467358 RepID=A0A9N9MQG6_9CUCU|nr:unnamed protein product [Ceutorhynchus assimilis]
MLPRYYKQDIDNRKQQINTLKIFNDNVKEIKEDSEYEVQFYSGENNLILKVSLGADFPKEKPVLVIQPKVDHPWVKENGMVINAPGLLNFTPHSDLGRVVQAIIRELQRNPPALLTDNSVISSNIPINGNETRTSPNFSNYNFSPPQHSSNNKAISLVFPELNQLTNEDLRFLNESEERQIEFIDSLPPFKEQNRILDELLLQIEDIAEDNLNKEQQLSNLKASVDSRIEEVTKLAFDNERLYSVYQNLSEKYSPRNIQEELGKAAKTAEEDGEQIAESFLKGDLDVDKFLNNFIKSKSLYQMRKTKEEKLSQQLDRLEKAGF